MTSLDVLRYAGSAASDVDGQPMSVLLVEDSDTDALLLTHQLRRDPALRDCAIKRVSTLAAALRLLAREAFAAIVIDLGLPDSDGLRTFTDIASVAGAAAVVVVTGANDQELAEIAVLGGAQDYIVKSIDGDDVGRAVVHAIRRRTVLARLEDATRQQLDARDTFLSHVSHELRAPLSVVHQFTTLLLDEAAGAISDEQRDLLGVVMRNTEQLRAMIDDLLQVGRMRHNGVRVHPDRLAMSDLVADVVAAHLPAAAAAAINLMLEVNTTLVALADEGRVREVLTNVLDNAMKFTPAGGTVVVQVDALDGLIAVSVRDTGCGITKEDAGHIFEEFYQSQPSDEMSRHGLGLGLFLSKGLIERQGGRMWAEGQPGVGTTVYFTLPKSPTQ